MDIVKLIITENALRWFQQEWGFKKGDNARIFVHYGGSGGFSIGVRKDKHKDCALSTVMDGIRFYLSDDDAWYLDNQDLVIDHSPEQDDIVYTLQQS